MAATPGCLVVLLVVAGYAATASATTYYVGDSQGWTTGVNYNNWANGKVFNLNDELVFKYVSKAHTVTEVSQNGFDSCSGSNALSDDDSGYTTIRFTTPGEHYYICNIQGHCAQGMKLAVSVSATPTPYGAAAAGLVPAAASLAAAAAAAAGAAIALF